MAFDLDTALRRIKPQRRRRALVRRSESELPWIDNAPLTDGPVLFDATVYFDLLRNVTPPGLDALIRARVPIHSAVCIAELTHAFGRLDPGDPRTPHALETIRQALTVPEHRLLAPDTDTWGSAGILAGLLFRLGSFPRGAEHKCLNDSLVYLQARKLGCPVLTRNVRDFDFLNQLLPDGRVLLYHRIA